MLSHKAVHGVQDPLGVDEPLELSQEVLVPGELATGGRGGAWVVPHLTLQGQRHVVGITVPVSGNGTIIGSE